MKEIVTEKQFGMRQPAFPKISPTDGYYRHLANLMAAAVIGRKTFPGLPETILSRVVVGVVGYLQDILTDGGLWRSFIEAHRRFYGRWLPFYEVQEDYIPHELNEVDVRFLVWYTIAMSYEPMRLLDPLSAEVRETASLLHAMLDKIYDDAPEPADYHLWKGLEIGNPEEKNELAAFSHWLFLHSYLMSPAFAVTLGEILKRPGITEAKNLPMLGEALDEAMVEVPTGPMALYLGEWLRLILEGKMPEKDDQDGGNSGHCDVQDHPTYTKLMRATGGKPDKFIKGYDALNEFFISSLGWEAGEKHLATLEHCRDFVLMVDCRKGLLIAHDICRCIKMDDNPYYEEEYAGKHAIELLTMRGCCPGDLLRMLFRREALPDAVFPGSDNHALVQANRDFIARCYLQQYYLGD